MINYEVYQCLLLSVDRFTASLTLFPHTLLTIILHLISKALKLVLQFSISDFFIQQIFIKILFGAIPNLLYISLTNVTPKISSACKGNTKYFLA